MSDTMPAHEILEKIFDTVIKEAKERPAFAQALLASLPQSAVARIEKAPRKPSAPKFDATSIPAARVMKEHGEATLRSKLGDVRKKADLKAVAEASAIVLEGPAAKKTATTAEIIDCIVAGANRQNLGIEEAKDR